MPMPAPYPPRSVGRRNDPKPAYLAAQTPASQLKGYRFKKRLVIGDEATDYVLLFSKDADPKQVKLAAWTTVHDVHKLSIPASAGTFHATDYLGKSLADVDSTDAAGLIVPASDGVQYLSPDKPDDRLSVAAARQRAPLESMTSSSSTVLSLTISSRGVSTEDRCSRCR